MCRPNSASNGEGAKAATLIKCNSWPGAISSQAASRPMLLGRAIERQPSASEKNVVNGQAAGRPSLLGRERHG